MNKSQPIKNKEKLDRFKNFYIEEEYNPRNYMFISLGLNTALRVSDLLKFTWNDVYNFDNGCFRTHVKLTEQKTTKQSVIFLNSRIINSLSWYKSKALIKFLPDTFLFSNADNQHISRSTAYRIVHNAAVCCEIEGGNQSTLPSQDLWLLCMETRHITGSFDGHLSALVI